MLVCKTFTASVTSASSKAEVLARRSNFIEPGPSSLSTTERDQNFDQVSFFSAPEPIKNRIKFPFWSRWVRKKNKGHQLWSDEESHEAAKAAFVSFRIRLFLMP